MSKVEQYLQETYGKATVRALGEYDGDKDAFGDKVEDYFYDLILEDSKLYGLFER